MTPSPTTTARRDATRPEFSPELFDRLWTIHDVAAFAAVSVRLAWRLMARDDAPGRLVLGARTVRWDPTAVVEFVRSLGSERHSTRGPRLRGVPSPDLVTVIQPGRRSVVPDSGSGPRRGSGPWGGR